MNKEVDSFEVAMLIREIYSKTTNIVADKLRGNGLTYQQIIIIKLIGHNREITISDICTEMSLTKGTVSGIVSRMEALGYVEKHKKDNDKRNTYLKLSDQGKAFAFKCKDTMIESFDEIFKEFTEDELKKLKTELNYVLEKIN